MRNTSMAFMFSGMGIERVGSGVKDINLCVVVR